MSEKIALCHLPRVRLWLVLVLTLAFSGVLLVGAHLTHSLTLRVEAYHAIYNVLTLSGCLLAVKLSSGPQSLHNTFGWARLEVLSMLTTLLFLTALCFSVSIESMQTALHVGHQDAMHHPLPILTLGGVGLALNVVVFFLIGGYTHHQGCFLEMRDSGSVWVGRQVTQEAVQAGRRTLSSSDALAGTNRPQRARQLCREVVRDTCGLVILEVCAALVYWDDGGVVALYIDPALAVTSAALLVWLSHPYGSECCHILLQTIPGHIDVEAFQRRVLKEFPAVVSIHHLHIWTFTPTKVVATAHVVFANPRVYLSTKAALRQFFLDEGITQVTIQPECLTTLPGTPLEDPSTCLLQCKTEQCRERECCFSHPLLSVTAASPPSDSSSRNKDGIKRTDMIGETCGGDGSGDGGSNCESPVAFEKVGQHGEEKTVGDNVSDNVEETWVVCKNLSLKRLSEATETVQTTTVPAPPAPPLSQTIDGVIMDKPTPTVFQSGEVEDKILVGNNPSEGDLSGPIESGEEESDTGRDCTDESFFLEKNTAVKSLDYSNGSDTETHDKKCMVDEPLSVQLPLLKDAVEKA